MSDESIHALARRALEAQDPHQLVRLMDTMIRERIALAATAAEPRPARGPYQPEAEAYETPIPPGYRSSETSEWTPARGTRLRSVIAIDNEPLYDRVEVEPGAGGEWLFFATGLGGYVRHGPMGGWGKNRTWTNVVNNGRLSEPERFEIKGVSLVVREDAPEEFVSWLRHETYFELRLGGGASIMDRQPSWLVTANRHRTRTGAVLADDLYVKPPVLEYPPDTTFVIEVNENFGAAIISDHGWKPRASGYSSPEGGTERPEAPPTVMCILHGLHAKGVRRDR